MHDETVATRFKVNRIGPDPPFTVNDTHVGHASDGSNREVPSGSRGDAEKSKQPFRTRLLPHLAIDRRVPANVSA